MAAGPASWVQDVSRRLGWIQRAVGHEQLITLLVTPSCLAKLSPGWRALPSATLHFLCGVAEQAKPYG